LLLNGCEKFKIDNVLITIDASSIIPNANTVIIATREDASVLVSLHYFYSFFSKKAGNSTDYPDYYEVYLSKDASDKWEMIRTLDTSYINKSFEIKGLTNDEIYYVFLKEIFKKKESKYTNVAMFIPSSFKSNYSFIMDDYFNHDLYSFSRNSANNLIVYATHFYEYQPNHAAPSIFISEGNNVPELVDINCWFPDFNNDGTKISYSSTKGEIFDGKIIPEHIVIYDVNTKKSSKVTSGSSFNKFPAWSPDNSMIAYSSSTQSDESLRITLYNLETNSKTILQTGSDLNPDVLYYSQVYPTWSSDGKYIYYTNISFTTENINPGFYDIYRISSSGGVPEPVFKHKGIKCTPAISPDNSKLAFLTNLNGELQIWVYDFNNNKLHQPFDTNDYFFLEAMSQLKWKNNNTILFTAYSEERGGDFSLFSISVE